MPRSHSSVPTRRRRNKVLSATRGYWGGKSKIFKSAKETLEKGLQYAYRDRRARKRAFRSLWITRINAAARLQGVSYSALMSNLKKKNISIDRKILAELAVSDIAAFNKVLTTAMN